MSNGESGATIDGFRTDYDSLFTADISQKMQMPDRLTAANNYDNHYVNFSADYNGMDNRRFYNQENLLANDPIMLRTPPSMLTMDKHRFTAVVDEDEMNSFDYDQTPKRSWPKQNIPQDSTSQSEKELTEEDIVVPFTPGTMLLVQNGDTNAVIHRQIAKLARHVVRLQDENRRRKQRELILYPLVFGYIIVQLGRFFLFRSK